MPFSIVEIGDVAAPDTVFSDFVGVNGISDRADSSLTVCNAFSIRRLQFNTFLAFSVTTESPYVKKYHLHFFKLLPGKRNF
jgi:hypothetical protein